MSSPELLVLTHELGARDKRLHEFGLVPGDDDNALAAGIACGIRHVAHERLAEYAMGDLRQIRPHAGALAGGKDQGDCAHISSFTPNAVAYMRDTPRRDGWLGR